MLKISLLVILIILFGTGIYVVGAYLQLFGLGSKDGTFSVTGTMRFIDLEGGFWGIIGDDQKHYDPINLSSELQKEGLRAEFKLKIAENQVGFHMWGTIVEVKDYKILK